MQCNNDPFERVLLATPLLAIVYAFRKPKA
jgi:hypothetical protein